MTSDADDPPFKRPRLADISEREDSDPYDVPLPPTDASREDNVKSDCDQGAPAPVSAGLEDDEEGDRCSICLNAFRDRAVLPTCAHEFCFECITIWTEQSRRCPLCTQAVGEHIIHHIRSPRDFQRYFLPPLRGSPPPVSSELSRIPQSLPSGYTDDRNRPRPYQLAGTRVVREWGRRDREREELDELERAVEKRRWVYAHRLYAKHVASNPHTRYRPFPTPAQFSASDELQKRATAWLRRELRVFPGLEIEWLTTFVVSLMRSLDIRSEGVVKLLAEFLDMDSNGQRDNATQFAHELYSYLRSPYRGLFVYDSVVQYDIPPDIPPPHVPEVRTSHWRPARARSRSRSRSSSRSLSPHRRSPSPRGRIYEADHNDGYHHAGPSRQPRTPEDEMDVEPDQSPRDRSPTPGPRRRLRSKSPEFVSRKDFGRKRDRSQSRDGRSIRRSSHSRSRSGGHKRPRHYYSPDRRRHSRDYYYEQDYDGRKGKGRAYSSYSDQGRRSDRRSHRSPSPRDYKERLAMSRSRSAERIKDGDLNMHAHEPDSSNMGDMPECRPVPEPPLELRIRGAAQPQLQLQSTPAPVPTSASDAPSRPRTRPPRGLDLRSSIAAHLSAPSSSSSGPSSAVIPSTRLSLQDRLTGSVLPLPSPPAQDVLQRTRARVARRRGEIVAGVDPSPATPAEGSAPASASMTPLPIDPPAVAEAKNGDHKGKMKEKESEGGVPGQKAGTEIGELRKALLERLEGERRAAAMQGLVTGVEKSGHKERGDNKETTVATRSKVQEAEAILRAQAHDRMRLARAKGEAEVEGMKAPANGVAATGKNGMESENVMRKSDDIEREARLRAQLTQRRT